MSIFFWPLDQILPLYISVMRIVYSYFRDCISWGREGQPCEIVYLSSARWSAHPPAVQTNLRDSISQFCVSYTRTFGIVYHGDKRVSHVRCHFQCLVCQIVIMSTFFYRWIRFNRCISQYCELYTQTFEIVYVGDDKARDVNCHFQCQVIMMSIFFYP